LPAHLSEKTLKGIADFLEKHEKEEILDKLETQLKEMTDVIEEKRARLKVLRPQSDKAKSA
jgi:chromosome segregation ATPase